ncbi:MAG: hypothetical protein LBU32_13800 [Clostridiales bacterium]|nr:hypothetical protein [Clostridiales bacterium]
MEVGELYSKAMPLIWVKLLLGLATVLVSAVLIVILTGMARLFTSEGLTGMPSRRSASPTIRRPTASGR